MPRDPPRADRSPLDAAPAAGLEKSRGPKSRAVRLETTQGGGCRSESLPVLNGTQLSELGPYSLADWVPSWVVAGFDSHDMAEFGRVQLRSRGPRGRKG
jgi:hypothetical protein